MRVQDSVLFSGDLVMSALPAIGEDVQRGQRG